MLHHRKGSYPRAPRRFGARWSGLITCVAVGLLLLYRIHLSLWVLPPLPLLLFSSCPATRKGGNDGRFNQSTIPQHYRYPLESFVQLPPPLVLGQQQEGGDKKPPVLPRIQHDFTRRGAGFIDQALRLRQRNAVKATFKHFWASSSKFRHGGHTRSQYAQTPSKLSSRLQIDSLDTLYLMGLQKDFAQAVLDATTYDFLLKPKEDATLASTARHLNAILSAYDMTVCKDARLLEIAVHLATSMLSTYFDTPDHIPLGVHLNTTAPLHGISPSQNNAITIADLTSSHLAFTHLSRITGNPIFYTFTTHVTALLARIQNSTRIPGLWPSSFLLPPPTSPPISSSSPTPDDSFSAAAAQANTFTPTTLTHAHLPQMSLLLQRHPTSPQPAMLNLAVEATIRQILFRPVTPDSAEIMVASDAYTISSPPTKGQEGGDKQRQQVVLSHNISIETCALGSCLWLSLHSPPSPSTSSNLNPHISIPPTLFSMLACASSALANLAEDCSFDPTVWPKQQYPGYEVVYDAQKVVRPEVVQSVFVMWRVTGQREWLDVAWELWGSVDVAVRGMGMGGLEDEGDEEEMRLVVQTLKYFYLVFSPPSELSLDEWVMGNDGHAFRIGDT
ncbi:alpha-mannosidase IC [Pyrenophora seminiperda CCB06]|uniref:alpha-1,2-Mannosidase n=1 Tax=Pyrenophora seminiperda CCB06 TaxID=1302712 RepID=A0A3M7LZP9_9PLEO|nr:alpha-mannosidase IC [Pyrenophora seminiperda CCB06]